MKNKILHVFTICSLIAFSGLPHLGLSGQISPKQEEKSTIISLPHFEDFSGVSTPDFPAGWDTFIESTQNSVVETSHLQDPNSPPHHVRFRPVGDANAQLILITPEIDFDLSGLRVRFYARASAGTLTNIEVGTYDHEGDGTFTLYESINLTTEYSEYLVELDDYTGNDSHIAFRADPEGPYHVVFFDDFLLDPIPTEPVLWVNPDHHDFGQLQVGVTSHPKEFVISNQGIGTLTIDPQEISITGADAGSFLLTNLQEPVNLEPFESDTISVAFAPGNVSEKQAVLMVDDYEVTLEGEGIDATIADFPHLEDFNDVDIPVLPFGWNSFVFHPTSANARVETSTTGTPVSPPNHVRLYSDDEQEAHVMLISPPVVNLSNKKLSFWVRGHMAAGLPDLIVGTMSNPTDTSTFSPFFTVDDLTNTYEQYEFFFSNEIGEDEYVAFLFGDNAMQWTFVYIDDFLLEEISPDPIIDVSPNAWDFGKSQIGIESNPKTFNISNIGGGTLSISPEDIAISGTDSSDFLLYNLDDTHHLEPGQSTSVSIAFSPETTGEKSALLTADTFQVSLSGEGFDFTINDFPWTETFAGVEPGDIPVGWDRDRENWAVNNSSSAGGEAPEMRFHWTPEFVGESRFKSPQINTEGLSKMMFSFRHMVNNFQNPGEYSLKVKAIAGEEEYLIYEWVDPDNINAQQVEFILTAEDHGIGAENLRFAWVFDGDSYDITSWFIDDITLDQAFTATFFVGEDNDDETPIEGAAISIEGYETIYTNEEGLAGLEMDAGNFLANINKEGYVSQEVSFTLDDNVTIEVLLKDIIVEPFGLDIVTEGMQESEALFSWQIEFDEFRYDDGVVDGQLGFQDGDLNSVMGAVHHKNAMLHEMTWFLTDNAGPYPEVKLWVLGLDGQGYPDRDNVIYTAENVPNEHMQWNTYMFDTPLEAPEGFFIGVSAPGFLALATDDGVGEPWEFIPETQFANLNIMNPEFDFYPIEEWDFHNNFLIRAYGEEAGPASQLSSKPSGPAGFSPTFIPLEKPFKTDPPDLLKNEKAFSGFNVFLNDMDEPIAANITEVEYLFTGLSEGEHTAGVQSVYTTGTSGIATIEFTYTPEEPLFSVTFNVFDEQGDEIPDAVITLDETSNDPGDYLFADLPPGNYPFIVYRDGFHEYSDQLSIVDEDLFIDVTLVLDEVSVSGPDKEEISIFPNPSADRIFIRCQDVINTIKVVDLFGRVIYFDSVNSENFQIDVSQWDKGLYFVQVAFQGKVITHKIQVVR